MDELLYNAINTYYTTVSQTGYIPDKTIEQLVVLDFLIGIQENEDYSLLACKQDRYAVAQLYNCIINNNCLI